jgi:4-hydroxy-3-methylbut-2-en-1-yl diphosphate synthase IspG/GcpE
MLCGGMNPRETAMPTQGRSARTHAKRMLMGIPGQYAHDRMRAAFATVANAAKAHGKAMRVGGVRQDSRSRAGC